MNERKVIGAIGVVWMIVAITYMVLASPVVEERMIGVAKYPLPKSDVDCSNCQLVRTVFPQSTLHIPYQSANGRDWESNYMYIVPVSGGHEFRIKETTLKEWEEEGNGIYYLDCRQPTEEGRRLFYLFVFEGGGIRRTCSESYTLNYPGEWKEWGW